MVRKYLLSGLFITNLLLHKHRILEQILDVLEVAFTFFHAFHRAGIRVIIGTFLWVMNVSYDH